MPVALDPWPTAVAFEPVAFEPWPNDVELLPKAVDWPPIAVLPGPLACAPEPAAVPPALVVDSVPPEPDATLVDSDARLLAALLRPVDSELIVVVVLLRPVDNDATLLLVLLTVVDSELRLFAVAVDRDVNALVVVDNSETAAVDSDETAWLTAYNCDPLIASVELDDTRPAAKFVI